ncbi:microtubule-actin cross-linking factor 1, isoforms 1/2/3/5-like isoform X2 [Anneissia japonica]|uniref:microtubule-actin cross-linking factor 1, isoforms 1/2/3/5-like isoform X2 n=1 Tax=Anneissia japonica TaxID=1529436 RepID=UPI00142555FB|nr:microtubule-actin cross-linking factor 1, isoforms 1/2/3/5-like isoform X2 [Anneissia japonica]
MSYETELITVQPATSIKLKNKMGSLDETVCVTRQLITDEEAGKCMEIEFYSREIHAPELYYQYVEEPPCLIRQIIDTEVDEGDIVMFDCRFHCYPPPDEIRWCKDGRTLTENKLCIIRTEETVTSLLLCDVSREDSGDYVVEITNACGKITSKASLHVYLKEERWIRLQDKAKARTQALEQAIKSLSDFESAHNRLKTWLSEKEKMMSVLGPIGVEPGILRNQKQQIEVLQEEFASHEPQMEYIKEAGKNLLEKQDPQSRLDSALQQQINDISKQWDDLKNRLDDREDKIDNVLLESEKFHDNLQDFSDWLTGFGNKVTALPAIGGNPEAVKQQMEKTKNLQREVENKSPQLQALADGQRKLGVLNPELTATAEVSLKLDSAKAPYHDICRKLDERQGKLQAALLQSQDFEDSYANMLQWLGSKDKDLATTKPISAKPEVLRRQIIEFEETPKELVKQVYTYDRMIEKVQGLMDEAKFGPEYDALKEKHDKLKDHWDNVNHMVGNRQERLNTANEKCKAYTDELNQFLPWLRTTEDRLASVGPVSTKPNVVKRQLDTLKQIHDDINNHRDHHLATNTTAEKLIGSTDVDHPFISDEVTEVNRRWDNLNEDMKTQLLAHEDLANKLGEFHEKLKDSQTNISRFEERLASHDALGMLGRDPKNLEKLKALQDEVDEIDGAICAVHDMSGNLMSAAPSPNESAHIRDEVDGMKKRYTNLKGLIADRHSRLEAGAEELSSFQLILNDIKEQLDEQEDIQEKQDRIGRDLDVLTRQAEEAKQTKASMDNIKDDLHKVNRRFRDIIDRGFLSDPEGLREQTFTNVPTSVWLAMKLDNLGKRHSRLKQRCDSRNDDVNKALAKVREFHDVVAHLDAGIDNAADELKIQKPVGADVETIKAQQKEFKAYVRNHVDVLAPKVKEMNRIGQSLVQSAAPRVNTGKLESEMERINEKWAAIDAKKTDRIGKLNEGLLRCGRFQEALQSLNNRIGDMEELVSNKKDPSSDYKVVKAQLSEQQLLDKMITDLEPSVEALKTMGEQLAQVSETQDKARINQQLSDLDSRWGTLVEAVRDRRRRLEATEKTAKGFQEQISPVMEWIEKTERRLGLQEPVGTEHGKIEKQIVEQQDLHYDITDHNADVQKVIADGQELLKQCSGKEVIDVQQKLDAIKGRYADLVQKSDDRLSLLQQALPLATEFEKNQVDLSDWLDKVENEVKNFNHNASTEKQRAKQEKLQNEIDTYRDVLKNMNSNGTKLMDISPGQGSADVRQQMTSANDRFNKVSSQVKDVEYKLSAMLEGAQKVEGNMDNLLAWLQDIEKKLNTACKEPISIDPDGIRDQLKKAKALDRDIHAKESRVQDTIGAAEKLLEQTADARQKAKLQKHIDELDRTYKDISNKSNKRVEELEEALPLTLQFVESHEELAQWLNDIEAELRNQRPPGLDAEEIKKEVNNNRLMQQMVAEKQQHINKLNRIAPQLCDLSPGSGARGIQAKVEDDNKRYEKVKEEVNKKGNQLFDFLQRTTSFVEDLDSALEQLGIMSEKLGRPEGVSSDPHMLRKQIKKLQALQNEVDNQMEMVESMKKAGNEMIKSSEPDDPSCKELQEKINLLGNRWESIVKNANERSGALQETLLAAESFWDELQGVHATVKELHETIKAQDLPAVEVNSIKEQQDVLQAIKEEIDSTAHDIETCRQFAADLMKLCGDAEKPEVQKNIDELNNSWDALNTAYEDREDALVQALNLATQFEEDLIKMMAFLNKADEKLAAMEPVGADPETVRQQLDEIKDFKEEVDKRSVELEKLHQQCNKLLAKSTEENAEFVKGPLSDVDKHWKELNKAIFQRQHQLQAGLLALGQLDGSLDELKNWLDRTNNAIDEEIPIISDPKFAEIELAKHKILQNDIMAHEPSLASINQAVRNFAANTDNPQLASVISAKLDSLNKEWENLVAKGNQRQKDLENALGESKTLQDEARRLLSWLRDIDGQLSATQPVGGLPETAKEQLEKHNELMRHFDREIPAYQRLMETAKKMTTEGEGIGQLMDELKTQWNTSRNKADERKKKLEDALAQAQQFHDALQAFISWLTTAEKYLNSCKPPSTVLETILQQIQQHKEFMKDLIGKKQTVLDLDRTGTQLKYFSQKQDVILIKNLLISVQNRWEKVQNRSNERSRQLEAGNKRAKQFDEQYNKMYEWLSDADNKLTYDRTIGSDPATLKAQLRKHKEFQRALGAKQPNYDTIVRNGRALREKSDPNDMRVIGGKLSELKDKWELVCAKSVDRQRKLEEALLFSGQFKDALQALLDWVYLVEPTLSEDNPVHGDIDTVINLMEAHKQFQRDLSSHKTSVKSVHKSAKELMESASEDTSHLKAKLQELTTKWENVCQLSGQKQERLDRAMKEAEAFHEAVHHLLEWLADAEQSLRFHGPMSENVEVLQEQLEDHKDFKRKFQAQESELNKTTQMGVDILAKCHPDAVTVIKHWITVIQARWEEVNNWSTQRGDRLTTALDAMKDNAELVEALLEWLANAEDSLQKKDATTIPDDIEFIQNLLDEHQAFEDDMASKQTEVDKLTKPRKRRLSVDNSATGIPMLDRGRRTKGGKPRSRDPSPGPDSSISPRVSLLFNKWKQVWLMAMDRRRRLKDALDRQAELKKLKDFNFDKWRDRYVKWMNHKKARVMDFFRKLDTDRDGKLTRQQFIDGIIGSKFATNQLEMNAVADIFDQDGDGYIDYKEFISALWPQREIAKPLTDGQKIEDEVKRQVSMCTCSKQFKVQRIGESKYRFGSSQQMRLVRILRSTVMVRVGGGWSALDEFLVKNDPCRAKGRTNVELRERFILAAGVSQTMAPFQSKRSMRSRSPSECSTGSASMSGPLIKIREKKNISRPWQETPRTTRTRTKVTESPDGGITRTTTSRTNGTTMTRKLTTRDATPGTPASKETNGTKSGYSTQAKTTGRHTTVDYNTKQYTGGTLGEVTVRTITEETRTVTMPTHKRTTYTRGGKTSQNSKSHPK